MAISVEPADVLGAAAVVAFVFLVRTLLIAAVRWSIRLKRRRKRRAAAMADLPLEEDGNGSPGGRDEMGDDAGASAQLPGRNAKKGLVFDSATAKATAVVSGGFIFEDLGFSRRDADGAPVNARGLCLTALSAFFVALIFLIDLGFVIAEGDRAVIRVKTDSPRRLDFVNTSDESFVWDVSARAKTISPLSAWCYRTSKDPYAEYDQTGGFNSMCIEPASSAEDLAKLNISFADRSAVSIGFAGGPREGDAQRFIVQSQGGEGSSERVLDMFPTAQIATLDDVTLGYTVFPSLLTDLDAAHALFDKLGKTWHSRLLKEGNTNCSIYQKSLDGIKATNVDELTKLRRTGESNLVWSGMTFLTCEASISLASITRSFVAAAFSHVGIVETRMTLNQYSRTTDSGVRRSAVYATDIVSGLPIWLSLSIIGFGIFVAAVHCLIERRYASTEQYAILSSARGDLSFNPETDWRFMPAEKAFISHHDRFPNP